MLVFVFFQYLRWKKPAIMFYFLFLTALTLRIYSNGILIYRAASSSGSFYWTPAVVLEILSQILLIVLIPETVFLALNILAPGKKCPLWLRIITGSLSFFYLLSALVILPDLFGTGINPFIFSIYELNAVSLTVLFISIVFALYLFSRILGLPQSPVRRPRHPPWNRPSPNGWCSIFRCLALRPCA